MLGELRPPLDTADLLRRTAQRTRGDAALLRGLNLDAIAARADEVATDIEAIVRLLQHEARRIEARSRIGAA